MIGPKKFVQAGITLLELMIVLAVLSILAALALPSYEETMMRSRRSEAREALSDFAARQEQFFTNNKSYATTTGALGRSATTENGYYVITIPATSATTYTLTATAQAPQDQDADCPTLSLTSTGARTPVDCW